MRLPLLSVSLLLLVQLQSCEQKPENTWQTKPFINAFGEQAGNALFIDGEMLSNKVESAQINFALNEDLISGGYKQIFTFVINGSSSWGEDNIEVIAPNGESYIFEIYDGLLFNVDYESNEVSRFIELMNYEELEITSGPYSFSISTKGFIELYTTNFLQPST